MRITNVVIIIIIINTNIIGIHECTFEYEDLCGYVQLTSDNFDWTWGRGSTATPYTGPSKDVSTGTMEGKNPR